jgi:hypothetical protein
MNIRFRSLALVTALFLIPSTYAGDSIPASTMVARFYDIRAWTTPTYDLSLDSSQHSAAFITPANIQSKQFDYRTAGQRYASSAERTTPSRQEKVDSLIRLIEQTIAPETWTNAGGSAAINEVRDILVVRQTPANQDQIAALLAGLKDRQSETVLTRVDWFVLPVDLADEIIKRDAEENIPRRPVDLAELEKRAPGTLHFHARMLCLNGQTVSYISGRERSVLANESVAAQSQGVTTFEPFMGNAGAGIALQINPTVDRANKQATMTFFSTYNDPENPGKPVPVRAVATTQPLFGPPIQQSTPKAVRGENSVVQQFRSTVRLPLSTPRLVGAMTLEPTSRAGKSKELLMFLSVEPCPE